MRRSLTCVLIAGLAMAALPRAAQAHLGLRSSSPASGDTLRTEISELRLTFTADVALDLVRLRLADATGRDVALGVIRFVGTGKREIMVATDAVLPDGTYTLEWRVVGDDGHPVLGTVPFVVAGVASALPAQDPPATAAEDEVALPIESGDGVLLSPWAVTVRSIYFATLLFVVGALAFVSIVIPGASRRLGTAGGAFDEPTRQRLQQGTAAAAFTAALVLGVAIDLRIGVQADAIFRSIGGSAADATRAFRATLLDATWMQALRWQFTAALATAVGLGIALRRLRLGWWIVGLATPVLVAAPGLAGHAASTEPAVLTIALDALHVLAASAWLGALAVFALSAIPTLRRDADTPSGPRIAALAEAFTPLALACAATLAATGVAGAWLRVGSDEASWATAYGSTLQAKMGALLLVLAAGFYNWRRVRPRLGDEAGTSALRRSAAVELLGASLVVIATAILVATPLPH